MNVIIYISNKVRLNASLRKALGVSVGERFTVHGPEASECFEARRALSPASVVINAVHRATGKYCLGLPAMQAERLGIKSGDAVEVESGYQPRRATSETAALPAPAAPAPAAAPAESAPKAKAKNEPKAAGSLRERMSKLKVGGELEVTASAAKSGAYSIAKDLRIKIKRVAETKIKRVA